MSSSPESDLCELSSIISNAVKRPPCKFFSQDQLTVVTELFDQRRYTLRDDRPVERYLNLCKGVLGLDVNIFIYTEPHLAPKLWKIRKDLGLLHKTYIYTAWLDESPYNFLIKRYQHTLNLNVNKPHNIYDRYRVLWNKFHALRHAIEINPFDTIGTVWLDIGIKHCYEDNLGKSPLTFDSEVLTMLNGIKTESVTLPMLSFTPKDLINNRSVYYSEYRGVSAAGCFGGNNEVMLEFVNEFDRNAEDCVNRGYMCSEEQIMHLFYHEHPEKCNITITSYPDVVETVPYYRGGGSTVGMKYQLCHARLRGDNYSVLSIGAYVLESLVANYTSLNAINKFIILDEIVIAVFYGIDGVPIENKDRALELFGRYMLFLIKAHPQIAIHEELTLQLENLQHYAISPAVSSNEFVESSTEIKNFTVFGERCSGTNFVRQAIDVNFDISFVNDYGHKHFFGHTDYNYPNDTLFVCVIRDPIEWLGSLFDVPWHLPQGINSDPDNFINSEVYSIQDDPSLPNHGEEIMQDRNIYTGGRYKNLFELRYTKLKFLIEDLPKKVKHCIVIKYEDLRDNYTETLERIAKLGVPIKKLYSDIYPVPVVSHKGDNRQGTYVPKDHYSVPKESVLIHPDFKLEYEQSLGYIK